MSSEKKKAKEIVVLKPCAGVAVCFGLSLLHVGDPKYLLAAWEISASASFTG